MTVKEILSESSYINTSLSNLEIWNEGVAEVAAGAIKAVVALIEKFVGWVRATVIPFLKRIATAIANLIRKTKLGRKILGDPKQPTVENDDLDDDEEEKEAMANMKRAVLQFPTWLNYIANSLINPNNVMKLANSTEDRSADINALEEKINAYIKDGEKTRIIQGFELAREEAKKQLEILEKSVKTFESNSNAIIGKCEELKRKLTGANDQGSAMRARNASAVLQMITRKTSQAINLSSENVLRLQKVVDPFKK